MIVENKKSIARKKYLNKNKIIKPRKKYDAGVKAIACKMKENGYSEKFITRITGANLGTRSKWHTQYNKSKQKGYIKPEIKKKGPKNKLLYYTLDIIIQKNRHLQATQICFLYNNLVEKKVCLTTLGKGIRDLGYRRVKGELRFNKMDENKAAIAAKEIEQMIENSKDSSKNTAVFF